MENPLLRRAIVVGLILTFGAIEVFAQSAQLHRISTDLVRTGFARDYDNDLSGSADQGNSRRHAIWLSGGREYRINGTCDVDCLDVDLALFSPSGRLVDSDRLADDYPQVVARPSTSGWYRLDVEMAHCSRAPCFYEVAVHSR